MKSKVKSLTEIQKIRKAEYQRIYRSKNREKVRNYSRKYYSENPELFRERRRKQYYSPEQKKRNSRNTYLRHSLKYRIKAKEYYETNHERCCKENKKRSRKHYFNNKEKYIKKCREKCEKLTNGYILNQLRGKKTDNIPQSLIETKRIQIKILRLCKAG